MANVIINDVNLTNIANAIRGKNGSSDTYKPSEMADAITNLPSGGGGDIEVEPMVLSGDQSYGCAGKVSGAYINRFGNTISTDENGLLHTKYMFNKSNVKRIPFKINIRQNYNPSMRDMFSECEELEYVPDIEINASNYHDIQYIFNNCKNIKTLPKLIGAYPNDLSSMFSSCYMLREIPDDYFDTWNFSRMNTYNSAKMSSMFNNCYSLRKIPKSLFDKFIPTTSAPPYYTAGFSSLFSYCYALDECLNVPVYTSSTWTSNVFSAFVYQCYMLKRLTFATKEDGTPKTVKWKSQTIDLNMNIGYTNGADELVYEYNSGITADKEVKNDATYQALKNDPDWFTSKSEYSRYNRTSAVETINSLPDASAYLAANGGTNTIKFKGEAGSATDGGAINTMTEEEIAIATAKGWTVSFA